MSASKQPRKAAARAQKFVPEFKGPIEGWVVNYLKGNAWRVARTMEFDDCMQEAHLVFLRVARTYPDVTDPPHFMALFKTSWERRFVDLVREDARVRENEVAVDFAPSDDGEGASFQAVGETDNEGELRVALRQAPREVLMVVNLLLRVPQEMLDALLAGWRGQDRRMRAGGSEHINRLLGLPLHHDTLQQVQDYFRGPVH